METSEKRIEIDWQDSMLKFMKLIGENTNEWYPELWEEYGISRETAKNILKNYEHKYGK
jgi:hypothetical protein